MIKKLLIKFIFISLIIFIYPNFVNALEINPEKREDPVKSELLNSSYETFSAGKWYIPALDATFTSNSGQGVTIAILDTGVTKTSYLSCHNFVSEYDAFNDVWGPGSAEDISYHGTLVAQTIADCNNGIAKNINIMPVRVFTDIYASYGLDTYTDDLAIAMGIVWAVDNNAHIINMSLGGDCYKTWEEGCRGSEGVIAGVNVTGLLDAAIKYAYDRGVLVIAASGNSALGWVSHPANNPYAWAVGAVNENLNKANFSNFGSALDFVAPGTNIDLDIASVDGTSFSSPAIAAAAAVLKSSYPGLSIKEIGDAFICTVVDLGDQGWDPQFGWGLVQIQASLDLLNAGLLQTPWWQSEQINIISEGNGKVKVLFSSADDCNGIQNYNVSLNNQTKQVSNNEAVFTVSNSGTYNASVRAVNKYGNVTSKILSTSITVDLTPPIFDSNLINISTDQGITIVWSDAIDVNGIQKYQVQLIDLNNVVVKESFTSSTEITLNTKNLIAGNYKVLIFAYDIYNNKSLPIESELSLTNNNLESGQDSTTTTTTPSTTTTIPGSSSTEADNTITTTTLPTISDPTTTNTVLGSPTITSINLKGSQLVISFNHAPAVKDLEIVAYGCSYRTVENGPAGGIDGYEVSSKTCTLDLPSGYENIAVRVHAKYGNYINCGTDNSSNCVQIDNEQWGPYTDWKTLTLKGSGSIDDSSITFTWDGQLQSSNSGSYTSIGSISGNCPLLSSSTAASSPLFKQVNSDVYPLSPTEAAFSGYEGCMYSGLTKDEIKTELVRYLDYWKQFSANQFKNLESVATRNWRNADALNSAANRWSSEWSGINSSSIVENLSRSDGQLVWDDSYWTVGLTTTTLPTISDPTTTNTVLGAPSITGASLSGSTLTISFNHAPAVQGLEIVAYGCSYYTVENGPAGGIDGYEVSSKTCVLDIPTNYPTVFVKVHAKYGNYINCGTGNSNCVQIDNAQWGPYSDWYSVTVFTPTTTTVPESSEESSETTTTTTTLPPSNTTTTTTTIPENCYEVTRAQFEQDYPELFGAATNWNKDTNSEYQVGDDYKGNGTVVETTPKGNAMYGSLRYRFSDALRSQTLDEWATNTCGG
ncbi:MAG: S8 family serine peptidase [Bacteroidetes bacterium]|nr:S8 family serine peptidase [Bacteroidota bacterium]